MKKVLLACLCATYLLANSNTHEGVVALKNGDYESAMANFVYAANSGDMIAQQNLGVMYHEGIGVPKNRQQASYWFNQSHSNQALLMGNITSCGCGRHH